MNRYALRFGYLGMHFYGYQRQPGKRTVEGDIILAMLDRGIIRDWKYAGFASASRTDRGVSALGNVLAVNSDFKENGILPAMNSRCEYIWFYGIRTVDDGFNPRHALSRHYRYYLPSHGRSIQLLRKAGKTFEGTHNFASFCYSVRGKETIRRLDSVDVSEQGPFVVIDVRGKSFLWGMIRMIVSAMLQYESGRIGIADIESGLKCSRKMDFGVAPPHPLVLVDVNYDFEFNVPRTKRLRWLEGIRNDVWAHEAECEVLRGIAERTGAAD